MPGNDKWMKMSEAALWIVLFAAARACFLYHLDRCCRPCGVRKHRNTKTLAYWYSLLLDTTEIRRTVARAQEVRVHPIFLRIDNAIIKCQVAKHFEGRFHHLQRTTHIQ